MDDIAIKENDGFTGNAASHTNPDTPGKSGTVAIGSGRLDTAIKKDYSDIANQQKNADTATFDTQAVNNRVSDVDHMKDASEYVSPESLAEERLQSMLGDSNNIMNKRLQSMGTMGANRAGLTSTSMGVGAAIGNAISGLKDVAIRDADRVAKAEQNKQVADYKVEDYKTQAAVSSVLNQQEAAQKNIDTAFQIATSGLDKATTARFEQVKMQWQTAKDQAAQEFDFGLQKLLADKQISAQEAADMRKYTSDIIQNHQVAVENLMGSTTFLELGPDGTANILNNLANGMAGSLAYIEQSAGTFTASQRTYLNNLASNFHYSKGGSSSWDYTQPSSNG